MMAPVSTVASYNEEGRPFLTGVTSYLSSYGPIVSELSTSNSQIKLCRESSLYRSIPTENACPSTIASFPNAPPLYADWYLHQNHALSCNHSSHIHASNSSSSVNTLLYSNGFNYDKGMMSGLDACDYSPSSSPSPSPSQSSPSSSSYLDENTSTDNSCISLTRENQCFLDPEHLQDIQFSSHKSFLIPEEGIATASYPSLTNRNENTKFEEVTSSLHVSKPSVKSKVTGGRTNGISQSGKLMESKNHASLLNGPCSPNTSSSSSTMDFVVDTAQSQYRDNLGGCYESNKTAKFLYEMAANSVDPRTASAYDVIDESYSNASSRGFHISAPGVDNDNIIAVKGETLPPYQHCNNNSASSNVTMIYHPHRSYSNRNSNWNRNNVPTDRSDDDGSEDANEEISGVIDASVLHRGFHGNFSKATTTTINNNSYINNSSSHINGSHHHNSYHSYSHFQQPSVTADAPLTQMTSHDCHYSYDPQLSNLNAYICKTNTNLPPSHPHGSGFVNGFAFNHDSNYAITTTTTNSGNNSLLGHNFIPPLQSYPSLNPYLSFSTPPFPATSTGGSLNSLLPESSLSLRLQSENLDLDSLDYPLSPLSTLVPCPSSSLAATAAVITTTTPNGVESSTILSVSGEGVTLPTGVLTQSISHDAEVTIDGSGSESISHVAHNPCNDANSNDDANSNNDASHPSFRARNAAVLIARPHSRGSSKRQLIAALASSRTPSSKEEEEEEEEEDVGGEVKTTEMLHHTSVASTSPSAHSIGVAVHSMTSGGSVESMSNLFNTAARGSYGSNNSTSNISNISNTSTRKSAPSTRPSVPSSNPALCGKRSRVPNQRFQSSDFDPRFGHAASQHASPSPGQIHGAGRSMESVVSKTSQSAKEAVSSSSTSLSSSSSSSSFSSPLFPPPPSSPPSSSPPSSSSVNKKQLGRLNASSVIETPTTAPSRDDQIVHGRHCSDYNAQSNGGVSDVKASVNAATTVPSSISHANNVGTITNKEITNSVSGTRAGRPASLPRKLGTLGGAPTPSPSSPPSPLPSPPPSSRRHHHHHPNNYNNNISSSNSNNNSSSHNSDVSHSNNISHDASNPCFASRISSSSSPRPFSTAHVPQNIKSNTPVISTITSAIAISSPLPPPFTPVVALNSTKSFHHRTGGPCDHCGCIESPQWRRGPPNKPTLCNACGTRFRRTNALASLPAIARAAAAAREAAAAAAAAVTAATAAEPTNTMSATAMDIASVSFPSSSSSSLPCLISTPRPPTASSSLELQEGIVAELPISISSNSVSVSSMGGGEANRPSIHIATKEGENPTGKPCCDGRRKRRAAVVESSAREMNEHPELKQQEKEKRQKRTRVSTVMGLQALGFM